jgi:hypothetical protein
MKLKETAWQEQITAKSQCSWPSEFWPLIIKHFNMIISKFCDWLWWVTVIPHSWQISSLLLPPVIAKITLSSVKLSWNQWGWLLLCSMTPIYSFILLLKYSCMLCMLFDIILYSYYWNFVSWHQIRVLHSKLIPISVTNLQSQLITDIQTTAVAPIHLP